MKLLNKVFYKGVLIALMTLITLPSIAQQLIGNNMIYLIGQVTNLVNGGPLKNQELFACSDTAYNAGFIYHATLYTDSEGYFYDTIQTSVNKGGLLIYTFDYLNNYHDTTVYFRFNWSEENVLFPNLTLPIEPPQIFYQANFYYHKNPSGLNPSEYQFFDITNSTDIIAREWDFGDGTFSSETNPVHEFTVSGVYRIMLTVTIKPTPYSIPFITSLVKMINVTVKNYFYLGGHVMAGYFPIDCGEAYLYKIESKEIVLIDTAVFNDTLGYYLFYQVIEGEYIVKADLCPGSIHFNHFMTTYYSNKPLWTEADTIFHNYNGCDYDIDLIPVTQTFFGEGSISGSISYGFDTDKGKNIPAVNIEILLCDENDIPLICCHSSEDGLFNFNGLDLGTYNVHAEVTGKYTIPVQITLDELNPEAHNIMLTIGDFTVNGAVNAVGENDFSQRISQPYPNPASDIVYLDFKDSVNEEFVVSLFNNIGKIVGEFSNSNVTETHQISIDTRYLDAGLYVIKLSTKDNVATRKFIKR